MRQSYCSQYQRSSALDLMHIHGAVFHSIQYGPVSESCVVSPVAAEPGGQGGHAPHFSKVPVLAPPHFLPQKQGLNAPSCVLKVAFVQNDLAHSLGQFVFSGSCVA